MVVTAFHAKKGVTLNSQKRFHKCECEAYFSLDVTLVQYAEEKTHFDE